MANLDTAKIIEISHELVKLYLHWIYQDVAGYKIVLVHTFRLEKIKQNCFRQRRICNPLSNIYDGDFCKNT